MIELSYVFALCYGVELNLGTKFEVADAIRSIKLSRVPVTLANEKLFERSAKAFAIALYIYEVPWSTDYRKPQLVNYYNPKNSKHEVRLLFFQSGWGIIIDQNILT